VDPDGRKAEGGEFRCTKCCSGQDRNPDSCAYASLVYGDQPQYVAGALALGHSLRASGTLHRCMLLHTGDVPAVARRLLAEFWQLTEVSYIMSAADLHTAPYDKARFKQVFTKLHVLNPDVLPFDRVVFLDLDTLVLRNVDHLFELRPPAAMYNNKTRGGRLQSPLPKHGERMDPHTCYFNAGTMVLAPSKMLFNLLAMDVQQPDPEWHRGAWSPEQSYLSSVLAGEWSHVSQLYNLEVQLHSGVPLSEHWECAQAADVAIAHFSGAKKAWDCPPDSKVSVVGAEWVRQQFARLPLRTQAALTIRCQALHAEWHRALGLALSKCRLGCAEAPGGTSWADFLRTGELGLPTMAPLGHLQQEAQVASFVLGQDVFVTEPDDSMHLAKVVRVQDDGTLMVWRTPSPSASFPFCAGSFGLCFGVGAARVVAVPTHEGTRGTLGNLGKLGLEAVAWLGEGHVLGLVVATRGEERLLRFRVGHAPQWFRLEELEVEGLGDGKLQCARCLRWLQGRFCVDGFWRCAVCQLAVAKEPNCPG